MTHNQYLDLLEMLEKATEKMTSVYGSDMKIHPSGDRFILEIAQNDVNGPYKMHILLKKEQLLNIYDYVVFSGLNSK